MGADDPDNTGRRKQPPKVRKAIKLPCPTINAIMNGRNALQEELMTTIKLTIEYDGKPLSGLFHKEKSTSIESKLTLAIRDVTGQSTQLLLP